MDTVGKLVKQIQSSSTVDAAILECSEKAKQFSLTDSWIRAVYSTRTKLPELDTLFDVHGTGTTVLTQMGISEEVQKAMWEKWPTLPEDVRASWVEDFKLLDLEEEQDVSSYVLLLVKLLT